MNTLAILWHESVLRHGAAWVEIRGRCSLRKFGAIVECPCGKRWLSRAPWYLNGGPAMNTAREVGP